MHRWSGIYPNEYNLQEIIVKTHEVGSKVHSESNASHFKSNKSHQVRGESTHAGFSDGRCHLAEFSCRKTLDGGVVVLREKVYFHL